MISLQHVADRLRCPIDLPCDLFDRSRYEFFANDLKLGLGPSSMILLSLDSILDDEAPAGLFWPPAVELQADYKLLKLGSRQHSGLSSHDHGFRTPLGGPLRQLGQSCHTHLDRDRAMPGKSFSKEDEAAELSGKKVLARAESRGCPLQRFCPRRHVAFCS